MNCSFVGYIQSWIPNLSFTIVHSANWWLLRVTLSSGCFWLFASKFWEVVWRYKWWFYSKMNAASVVGTITGYCDIQTLLVVKNNFELCVLVVKKNFELCVLPGGEGAQNFGAILVSTAGTGTPVQYEPPGETLTTSYLPLIVLKLSSLRYAKVKTEIWGEIWHLQDSLCRERLQTIVKLKWKSSQFKLSDNLSDKSLWIYDVQMAMIQSTLNIAV